MKDLIPATSKYKQHSLQTLCDMETNSHFITWTSDVQILERKENYTKTYKLEFRILIREMTTYQLQKQLIARFAESFIYRKYIHLNVFKQD